MINEAIGSSVASDGMAMRFVRAGEAGHLVYGPYRFLTSGVYQVDFTLGLMEDGIAADLLCATIDVTTDCGQRIIEERELRAARLSHDPQTYTLTFVLRDIVCIEHRVWVSGATALLVGCVPELRRISGILDVAEADPLGMSVEAAAAQAASVRGALSHLRPQKLVGAGLVRLGRETDGGYLCVDDFDGIDTGFSFGINDDISWDRDAADRGLTILQFDHTVDDPAPHDPRMIFERKMIANQSGADRQSLADLIRAHDRRRDRPNLILKMDIEGAEWDVFGATGEEEFARLAWIVCEIHAFQNLADPTSCADMTAKLRKLARNFGVVHVHSNTWGGYSSIGNVVLPNVLEVTLANRAVYELVEGDALFPCNADVSCNPELPDFFLGAFRF